MMPDTDKWSSSTRTHFAALLVTVSMLFFTIVDAFVKSWVPSTHDVFAILFIFGITGLIPVAAYAYYEEQQVTIPRRPMAAAHLIRSVVLAASLYFLYSAYSSYTLSDITLLWLAAPLLAIIWARMFLDERPSALQWTALIIGTLAIIVLAVAGSSGLDTAVLYVLLGTVSYSVVLALNRYLVQREGVTRVLIGFHAFLAVAFCPAFISVWNFDMRTILAMVVVGILQGAGQILLLISYRFAEVKIIAPFEFTGLLWAVLVGYLFFSESLSYAFVGLALCVLVANYFSLLRA